MTRHADTTPSAERRLRIGARALGPLAAGLLALLLGAPAVADAPREEPPVEIEADKADFDAARGISTYTGDAVLVRGQLRITGDRMEVYTDENGELQRVEVTGTPATYRDHPEGQPRPVRAEAPFMEYFASGPERASFQQGARLWQGDDEIIGETVDVNLEEQIVKARGGESGRARTILYPGRREAGE